MATNRHDRLREMTDEFRVAKQRQLVRRGITLWNRTEAQYELSLLGHSWPDAFPGASVWSKLAGHVRTIAQTECGVAGQPVIPCIECGTGLQHPVTVGLQRRVHRWPHLCRSLRDRTEMFGTAFRSELEVPEPAMAAGPDRRPPARRIERLRSTVSARRAPRRRG
jgi:hypothetical protein